MLFEQIKDKALSYGLENGYIYIAMTDRIVFEKYHPDMDITVDDNKILECRIFNDNGEYKAIRTDLDSKWYTRYIDDSKEYIEEKHYLDIDTKKCIRLEDGTYDVIATGGGKYHLPFNNIHDTFIILHNYIDYEKDGQVYVYDYRLVGIGVK